MNLVMVKRNVFLLAIIVFSAMMVLEGIGCAVHVEDSINTPASSPQPEIDIIPSSESSLTYLIVDTGQTACYNATRMISCPAPGKPFYGQDAQYMGNQPAYRDNGDGTVSDLITGLVWQQIPDNKVTFAEAIAGAEALSLGGYNDWRLPTIKELYSLILFSGTDPDPEGRQTNLTPFIDTDHFYFEYGDTSSGERIIDAQYWSATEYQGTTMENAATVFGVNFADGRIKGYPRDTGARGQITTHFVRYVRNNPDYGINRFIDNDNGTVTDAATGLMWPVSDSGKEMDWQQALFWVQQNNTANYLGYSDWRLPNAKELQSLIDYSHSPQSTGSPAIDPIFEVTSITSERGMADYPYYWSSTTHADARGNGNAAVYIAFGEAMGYMHNTWMDVHGAGAQRSDPKTGDPDVYPHGRGPQGDAIRIYNFVRCVRNTQ